MRGPGTWFGIGMTAEAAHRQTRARFRQGV